MALSCCLNMDRQVCVIQTVLKRVPTDRQTHGQTDRKVKTEGRKTLLNDTFFFKTAILSGQVHCHKSKFPLIL